MATKQKADEPFANNSNPDGGAEPVVRPEPDLSFEERTRVDRAWEVGDKSPKDPQADESVMIGKPNMKRPNGEVDTAVATPIGKQSAPVEGHESPDRNDGGAASQTDVKLEDAPRGASISEQDTEALKHEEETPSNSAEAINTQEAEKQKGVDTGARNQAPAKTKK